MTTNTPVTSLNAQRYAETFAVFVSRSHEYPAMIQRLVDVAETLPPEFSCLDIGAGTGMVVRDWLTRTRRRPGLYFAIEPNPTHTSALRQSLSQLSVDAELDEADFHPDYAISGTYDLVLFSHSLYWMPDPVACVRHARNALKPDGKIIAFLQGPFGDHPMYHLFNPHFERDRPPGPNHGFSSAELVVGLRRQGIEPSVAYDPTPHDLTGLFDRGNEAERDEYLSFCLQIEFKNLHEPWKSDVLAYVQAACFTHEGRLHWLAPNATVTISG
ncbi:MAG: class I SAM-dependent methyltransferase [Pseudomonadota bacterium]